MSHIDEGTLHAYLDRAAQPNGDWREIEDHLATCPECRERLVEARALRERAAAILKASGPAAVSQPPFDAVLARAGRGRSRRVFGLDRLRALGWAASIALAVGVGWMARGALNPLRSPEQPLSPRASRTTAVDTATPSSSDDARPGMASATQSQRAATDSTAGDARSTEAAAERLRSAYEVVAEPKAADEAVAGRRDAFQQNAAEPASPAPRGAPAAVAPQTKLARDIGAVAERREQPTRERAAELEAAPVPVQWVESDSADAATRSGEVLHTVPGLPVVRVDRDVLGDGRAVRVLQDLDGVMLEIVQRPAIALEGRVKDTVAADVSEMADTAGATVTVIRGRVMLTLRARIALDSLRSLAARIP
jgi:hypothetical protein